MKLGMEVGLSPSHIVLDGHPAPPKRGTAPNFRPMSVVAKGLDRLSLSVGLLHEWTLQKRLKWSRCHLCRGLLWACGPKEPCIRRGSRSPMGTWEGQFWSEWRPIVKYRDTVPSSVQKQLNRSRCCLGYGFGWTQGIVIDGGPDPPWEG